MTCKDCNNIPIGPYQGTNNECQACRNDRLNEVANRMNRLLNWRDGKRKKKK